LDLFAPRRKVGAKLAQSWRKVGAKLAPTRVLKNWPQVSLFTFIFNQNHNNAIKSKNQFSIPILLSYSNPRSPTDSQDSRLIYSKLDWDECLAANNNKKYFAGL
jgi:hypothetical protein